VFFFSCLLHVLTAGNISKCCRSKISEGKWSNAYDYNFVVEFNGGMLPIVSKIIFIHICMQQSYKQQKMCRGSICVCRIGDYNVKWWILFHFMFCMCVSTLILSVELWTAINMEDLQSACIYLLISVCTGCCWRTICWFWFRGRAWWYSTWRSYIFWWKWRRFRKAPYTPSDKADVHQFVGEQNGLNKITAPNISENSQPVDLFCCILKP
jgi:hypothetical protein